MNKTMKLAVAAALAMGASAAQAGITIPAGDWTIDIGGNVNAYYSHTSWDGDLESNVDGAPTNESSNNISSGLLPAALGIGGKTRQNDLDIAFQFTFFTGTDSCGANAGGQGGSSGLFNCNGADSNSLNIRQAYATFGDKTWGTVKFGRDLGIFGSDAILNDMTLLGVGIGAGGGGNSTLGRIGSGYLYADWVGQISYASPNWNGFSFNVGLRQPWGNSANEDLGYEGKVSYEWAGDVAGKVWVGAVHQKVQTAASAAFTTFVPVGPATNLAVTVPAVAQNEDTASAWEIGGKVSVAGFDLVGYYYDGKGIGQPLTAVATTLTGLIYGNGDLDVNGGYVQAMYTLPSVGTKLGVSWGTSQVEEENLGVGFDDYEADSWMVGVYHPLTKSLNLVAEYVDLDIENNGLVQTQDGDARTMSLGAILFF